MIPDVNERQDQGFYRLPLQIKGPILRIRQLIGGIVATEQKRTCTTLKSGLIWQKSRYTSQVSGRRRWSVRPERVSESCARRWHKRNHERRLKSHSERSVEAATRAGGKFGEEFSPVCVKSGACANHNIL